MGILIMRLFSSLSVVILFSTRISLSSSYSGNDNHTETPNICGGYCKGHKPYHPCFWHYLFNEREENARCEWANDHCCPPYGTGNEWPIMTTSAIISTTTAPLNRPTVPDICGGYCKGGMTPCSSHDREAWESCEWANDHCCPPFGDGSQWTTTTTTSKPTKEKEDEGLAGWEILLIILGVILLFAVTLGVCMWFCWFSRDRQRVPISQHQPWDNYGYISPDGVYVLGMKQPILPHPNQVMTTPEVVESMIMIAPDESMPTPVESTTTIKEASILHINPDYESQLKVDEQF